MCHKNAFCLLNSYNKSLRTMIVSSYSFLRLVKFAHNFYLRNHSITATNWYATMLESIQSFEFWCRAYFFWPKQLAYQQTNKRSKAFRFSSRPRCLSNVLELNKYEARVDCLAIKHVVWSISIRRKQCWK